MLKEVRPTGQGGGRLSSGPREEGSSSGVGLWTTNNLPLVSFWEGRRECWGGDDGVEVGEEE